MTVKRHDRVSSAGKPYHWYTLNGKKIDSVTSVLSKAVPKPALVYWAAKCVAEFVADNAIEIEALRTADRDTMVKELKGKPWAERDAAANRGTEVHALAEKLVQGEEVEVPPEIAGYVDQYVRFLNEWQPRPVLVEGTVANKRWGYGGQLDLVADLPNGERAVMDLKTSRGIYPETALQVAAYRHAEVYLDSDDNEQPLAGLGITASYVVHVMADDYKVQPINTDEDGPYKMFLHLLWLSRRLGKPMEEWLGEAVAPPVGVSV